MTPQSPQAIDGGILSLIKELSGKLIERRRRRDRISQHSLAKTVGCSERWIRELEGGAGAPALEDHIRCAHSLRMTTTHLFIPLLAMEHNMKLPRELLLQDDLWELERDILEVVNRYQAVAVGRLASRAGSVTQPDQYR